MIIFTVTNKITSQVYVGSTRNGLLDQWEKMVAAAEQNLDYPLYQEIRVHGPDAFVVEEWDYVDNRNELNALEQEAIKSLNARSLKGYKTSTLKIQPKKKTRTRKSNLEKELATILTDFDDGMDDFDDISPEPAKQSQNTAESQPEVASTAPVAVASGSVANVLQEAPAAAQKTVAEAQPERPVARPENGSQVNAVVQMSHICLSDDISAQLEAIQAAANGVLAGDNSAVELLNCKTPEPVAVTVEAAPIGQPEPEPEIVVELDPKEQRIRAAIARHRKARAQKTSDSMAGERQRLEQQLAELTARTTTLTIAAVA